MAIHMYNQGQDEQLIQEFTGHVSNAVRRYKNASDAIKCKASRIIQGEKRCAVTKLSQKKYTKRLRKSKRKHCESRKQGGSSGSDQEFMPSQNLRTYEGKPIEDGVKVENKCKSTNQCSH